MNIDIDLCLYNDYLNSNFDEQTLCKKGNYYYYLDSNEKKPYWDPDKYSSRLYDYWKIYLESTPLPNGKQLHVVVDKENEQYILKVSINDKLIAELTTDYIGPLKFDYEKKYNIKSLSKLLKDTRTFAGSMVWPCRKKGSMTINQYKGRCLKDRMDFVLSDLKDFYNNKPCTKHPTMQNCFEQNKDWFNSFCDSNGHNGYDGFINYFGLQNCFDDKIIEYQEYLQRISDIIHNRRNNIKIKVGGNL